MIVCHFSNRNSLYKYFFFHLSIMKNCPNTSVLRLNNDVVQDILYEWGFLKRKKDILLNHRENAWHKYEAILVLLKNVSQSILITLYYLLCLCMKIMSVCYVIVL